MNEELSKEIQGNNTNSSHEENSAMEVYIGLSATTFVLCLLVEFPIAVFCDLAANQLHDTMFSRVIRAPTRFYDTNPVGMLIGCTGSSKHQIQETT